MAALKARGPEPSVAFVTLGCAKNEADTARMRDRTQQAGFAIEADPGRADAIVVNTCSFIQSATEESLEAIFDVAGLPNVQAGAALVVAGCMPARYGEELAEELVEARAFVPCSREDDIAAALARALRLEAPPVSAAPLPTGLLSSGDAPSGAQLSAQGVGKDLLPADEEQAMRPFEGPAHAYVKISEGCERFCTFCTIPFIRGRYASRPLEEVCADVAAQVAKGVREIVLIAQDTGRWGSDFRRPSSLAELVSVLAAAFPQTWFRLMYIQPEGVTDELLDAVAAHDNVCDYFDIPLQHVDPAILHAMNRTGSRDEFRRLLERVRAHVPAATLRTTLIAGFPGESEQAFEDLCDFVEEGFFDYVGVFPYSREEGTRAFDLPGQIDEEEKAERARRLRDVADAVCCPRVAARIGSEMDVLVEGREEDGQLFGRARCQAPDADGLTYLKAGTPGEIRRVRIAAALVYEMEGE